MTGSKDSGSFSSPQHYEQMSVFWELTLCLERSCLLHKPPHFPVKPFLISLIHVVCESTGSSINDVFLQSTINICSGVFPLAGGIPLIVIPVESGVGIYAAGGGCMTLFDSQLEVLVVLWQKAEHDVMY